MCHIEKNTLSAEKLAELEIALAQSRKEITAGEYVIETVEEHTARLEAMPEDKA